MTFSKLDSFYRSILLSRYFIKGWGSPENLKRLLLFRKVLSNRSDCIKLVGEHYPIEMTKDVCDGEIHILEGHFYSPFNFFLPTLLPRESKEAYFQMILPRKWKDDGFKPVCIHMAGTGDHYFWRRRHLIAKPLLREAGIGSIILENPFYGTRKPVYQMRSVLNNVSDIFVMGGCLILEALVLLHWCTNHGFGPLGLSGLSMGGHMASLAATNWPFPLVLVPCLSWSTASGVFTEGVMSRAINWDMLELQYKENEAFRKELNKMVQIRESDAFQAGKEFVKNFPESMLHLKEHTPDLDMNKELSVTRTKLFSLNRKLIKILKGDPEPSPDLTNFSLLLEKVLYSKYIVHAEGVREDTLCRGRAKFTNDPPIWIITVVKKAASSSALFSPSSFNDIDSSSLSSNKQETINFMRGIMDECTHLKNFSVPVDTSLIISVCARDDGYVPRDGVADLSEIWPGVDVRFIDAGHVSAFVLHQKEFRQAIIEAFERYRSKYILH